MYTRISISIGIGFSIGICTYIHIYGRYGICTHTGIHTNNSCCYAREIQCIPICMCKTIRMCVYIYMYIRVLTSVREHIHTYIHTLKMYMCISACIYI